MAQDTEPLSAGPRVLQPVTTPFHGTSAPTHPLLGDTILWGEMKCRAVDPYHSVSYQGVFLSVPEAITQDRLESVGCGGSQEGRVLFTGVVSPE